MNMIEQLAVALMMAFLNAVIKNPASYAKEASVILQIKNVVDEAYSLLVPPAPVVPPSPAVPAPVVTPPAPAPVVTPPAPAPAVETATAVPQPGDAEHKPIPPVV